MAQKKRNYSKGKQDDQILQKDNRKRMSRGNSSKRSRQAREIADTAIEMSKSNPYTWYANFPQYAKDVASLAFGLPTGQPLSIKFGQTTDNVAVAGILAIYFTPSIGVTNDLTSPINRQAVRTYSYLRSIQRAAATYDSADLMMYMLGVDSLYTYWAYMRRAYGVAQLFTPTNKYYPRRLLQAMGVDPDIVHNLADFRAYINRFALNIGKFAMPSAFNLSERHRWMCSGIYVDSNTKKAQTYLFVPSVLWQFDNTTEQGGALKGVQFASFSTSAPIFRDLTSLMAVGDNLLNAFENDEDTMNISGDLYRAYEGHLLTVEETPDNYTILPLYDETVLSQIENSIAVGRWVKKLEPATLLMPAITQNPTVNSGAILFEGYVDLGHTVYNNKVYFNYPVLSDDTLINMHWDNPTPEQVMEATRLISKAEYGAIGIGAQGTLPITDCGSDIVNYYSIVTTNPDNPAAVKFLTSFTNTIFVETTGQLYTPASIELLAMLQQFDWGPMMYVVTSDANFVPNLLQVAADLDNVTYAPRQQLKFMNEAALLSLLDSPTPVSK